MKKTAIRSTAICLTAGVVLCTSSFINTKAISFTGEMGVAGIELTLKNVEATDVKSDVETVAAARNVEADTTLVEDKEQAKEVPTTEAKEAKEENEVKKEKAEEKEKEPVSEYANVGISIAPTYVNVRSKANTESKIMGKLYKGCAATILDTKGDWVKIKSGNVSGYIKSEYLAIGFDAEELVNKYGTKIATVNTTTLKVREKTNTDARVLTMIPKGESYVVLKESKKWVKVSIDGGSEETSESDDGIVGFVSKEYVDITVEFEEAISIEEEEAKKKAEQEALRAEQEQAERLRQEQLQQQQSSSSSSNSSSSRPSSNNSSSHSHGSANNNTSSSNNSSSVAKPSTGSGKGSSIAAYALKFVGNPYVYGGTSLTGGADCSGFVMSVYRSFGYSLPRTSAAQSSAGVKVSFGSLQPGDLVFYTGGSGRVNHVAMYIGGGQVVHASNPRTGIKVSSMNYRTPYTARRIVR